MFLRGPPLALSCAHGETRERIKIGRARNQGGRAVEETFSFCREQRKLRLTMGSLFTAIAAFGCFLYAFDNDRSAELFLILSAPLLLIGTWFLLSALILPTHAVSLDDEGIWLTRRGREKGLIQWDRVHETKERHARHRLDLLDDRGRTLLRLRGDLHDFDRLAKLVQSKVRGGGAAMSAAP